MRNLLLTLPGAFLAACLLGGCTVDRLSLKTDAPAVAAPMPTELAQRFAYTPQRAEPALERVEDTAEWEKFTGVYKVAASGEDAARDVTYRYWRSKVGSGPRPLVVIVPILAGNYPECDYLGQLMARSGMHAFFVHREDNLLAFDKDKSEPFEVKLRRSIVNIRRTLDWACAQPEVDPRRVGLVGISLGAIGGTIVLAVEPRITAGVLIMGGGDLPGIVSDSIETPVRRYKVHKMRDNGWTEAEFKADVRRQLPSDPLDYAPFIGPRRVQQFISLYDNKVPTEYQWKLWRALGEPEGYAIPIGHYTSIFYLGFAERNAMAFLGKHLGASVVAGAPLPAGGKLAAATPPR